MVDMVLSMGALLIVMVVTRAPVLLAVFAVARLLSCSCIFSVVDLDFLLADTDMYFSVILQYIYNAVLTAWLYLTPIMYPLDASERCEAAGILDQGL